MLDVQQKRKLRGFLYSRVTLGLLSILVIFFIHSTWAVYQKKEESRSLMYSSRENLGKLETRDKDLNVKIERLNTKEGIEEEIRSKFSVAKENEALVIVVQADKKVSTSSVEKRSFWQKIKEFLTKKE